jgi:hypothetical protein
MISGIFLFLMLTCLAWIAIIGIQKITKKQAVSLTKAAAYATMSATVAIVLLTVFVTLF